MMAITPQLMKRAHLIARISSHIGIYKSLPDIIHCHLRGVHHILRIETVIAQLVEHNFVGWKITSTTSTTSNPSATTRTYRRHTHQTHIMLGARSYPIGHQKQLTMYLLNNILGGSSMSSRLYLTLREKYGLVYNIDSQAVPLSDTGYWNIYLACEPQHKEQCLELCHKELKQLRDTRLTAAQLQRALRQLEGQMAISAENQENNALAMAKQMLYHHHAPAWQEVFAKVKEITAEQLQDVANEVFAPEKIYTLLYD